MLKIYSPPTPEVKESKVEPYVHLKEDSAGLPELVLVDEQGKQLVSILVITKTGRVCLRAGFKEGVEESNIDPELFDYNNSEIYCY